MKTSWNFEDAVSVFNREIDLLKATFSAQEIVFRLVLDRDWENLDEKTEDVKKLGLEFTALEEERHTLLSSLGDTSKPFYELISNLSFDEQRELSRLYRELKTQTNKMKALNDNLTAYINEAKIMATSYIEAVYPARGGKLYSRDGSRVSQDLKSIVLNSRF